MIINVKSPLNKLGYGQHSMNYMKTLIKNGFKINYTPIGDIQIDDKELLDNVNIEIKFDINLPTIMIFHENYADQISGNPKIYFPVWETSKIDEYSQLLLNQLDYIFVTSEWAKQVLIDNEITTESFVIREGVNPNIYYPSNDKYIDTGKFTFITVGKHEVRKNTDLIIQTFIDEFKNKDCALIAHTYNIFTKKYTDINLHKQGFLYVEDKQYIKFTYKNCDIYFTKPILENDLRSLYNSANIGIFTSRCEGWNLPLIECLSCGIPCIATNITGQSEYLDNVSFHELQGKLLIEKTELTEEVAIDNIWFKGNRGNWFTLNNTLLLDKIRYAHNNYKEFDRIKISKYIHNNFDWDFTAKRTLDAFSIINNKG